MRKTIITAVASAALAVPGIALASHQGEHQLGDDHGVHHGRHHAKHRGHDARVVEFGTVASFSNGTLTISRADGSTVSGKVTSSTVIECRSATAATASHGRRDDNNQGDDNNRGRRNNRGDDNDQGNDRGHDVGDDNGQDEAEHCTSAALVAGAVVREAELNAGGAGLVWRKLELER